MSSNLLPSYSESKALIIGINDYEEVNPLEFAANDAEAVANLLIEQFKFKKDDVILLTNADATQKNILREYLSFASSNLDENGRLIVYFAGHGHTLTSSRGEVGFLVPVDGNTRDLSTLIRWDQITRNADLIPSKHILYFMDACYGGLAITRALSPGTTRFLKDMLLRFSRQVITAGKANEVVSDSGGPLPGHSVFTGHILDALSGKAKDADGVLTANSIMSYVYHNVARDPDSNQTPHYGYLYGDGDFLFSAPILEKIEEEDGEEQDFLYAVPTPLSNNDQEIEMTIVEQTKEYLSDSRYRIHLHDLTTKTTREAMAQTSDELFPVNTPWNKDEFVDRLDRYEEKTSNLISIAALFGYWSDSEHQDSLTLPARRLSERIQLANGSNYWLALRWYPILLYTYSLGIASVASTRFENLFRLFHTPVAELYRPRNETQFIIATVDGVTELHNAFKQLPGHERQYVPRSEYLYKYLQPKLDDLLFLA